MQSSWLKEVKGNRVSTFEESSALIASRLEALPLQGVELLQLNEISPRKIIVHKYLKSSKVMQAD